MAVDLKDPHTQGVEHPVANLTYNPSGSVKGTAVTMAGSEKLYLEVVEDAMERPAGWFFYSGSGRTPQEFAGIAYDASGNVTSAHGITYSYDPRMRLVRAVIPGSPTENRTYDGFGNLASSNSFSFSVDRNTNRINTYPVTYDGARGQMIYDGTAGRNVGRDFYADGRLMSEFNRAYPSNDTKNPGAMSIHLLDTAGERAMTWSSAWSCPGVLTRHPLHDESGQLLTDYRAQLLNPGCDCTWENACQWHDVFDKDYVALGPRVLLTHQRNVGTYVSARDWLGSPRQQVNLSGSVTGTMVLAPDGTELFLAGTLSSERHRFTGHERDHVSGNDGQNYLPMSDYMHARVYVPMLTRFVSPDPKRTFDLFNPQSMNRYSYVLNNPLTLTDPFGLEGQQGDPPLYAHGGSGLETNVTVTARDPAREEADETAEALRRWREKALVDTNTIEFRIDPFRPPTQKEKTAAVFQGVFTATPFVEATAEYLETVTLFAGGEMVVPRLLESPLLFGRRPAGLLNRWSLLRVGASYNEAKHATYFSIRGKLVDRLFGVTKKHIDLFLIRPGY